MGRNAKWLVEGRRNYYWKPFHIGSNSRQRHSILLSIYRWCITHRTRTELLQTYHNRGTHLLESTKLKRRFRFILYISCRRGRYLPPFYNKMITFHIFYFFSATVQWVRESEVWAKAVSTHFICSIRTERNKSEYNIFYIIQFWRRFGSICERQLREMKETIWERLTWLRQHYFLSDRKQTQLEQNGGVKKIDFNRTKGKLTCFSPIFFLFFCFPFCSGFSHKNCSWCGCCHCHSFQVHLFSIFRNWYWRY